MPPAQCRGCEHHGIRARLFRRTQTAGREGDAGEDRGILRSDDRGGRIIAAPTGAQPSPERRADRSSFRGRRPRTAVDGPAPAGTPPSAISVPL